MFTIGYCFYNKENIKEAKLNGTFIDKIISNKYIKIIGIMLLLGLIYFKIKYLNATNNIIDSSELRMARFTTMFSSYAESIIYNYLLVGVLDIYVILFAVLLIEKKYKNSIFVMSLASILLYISIGYGRKVLLDIIIYAIIWFLVRNKGKININSKSIKKGIVGILIIFIISVSATTIRLGVQLTNIQKIKEDIVEEQIKQYFVYFLGGFRSLDRYIQNEEFDYEFGRMTLGGIDEIISLPFIALGYDYNSINSKYGEKLQENIIIGDNISFNAFYTCVMNFYTDFGIVGVILIPLLYGIILKCIIRRALITYNLFDIILMLFIISNTISAIYKWFYQSGSTIFTIMVILVLKKFIRIKEEGYE